MQVFLPCYYGKKIIYIDWQLINFLALHFIGENSRFLKFNERHYFVVKYRVNSSACDISLAQSLSKFQQFFWTKRLVRTKVEFYRKKELRFVAP